MSDETNESNEDSFPEDPNIPYIVFERLRNKGIRELKSADGKYIQRGEHKERWKCMLANPNGELFTWATVAGMQQYVAKGYVPLELHNFESYLARKDPNQDMVQEFTALYAMFSRTVNETAKLREALVEAEALKAANEKLIAEMEKAKKELAELKKQSAKDKAADKVAEGTTVVHSTKGGQAGE